jgi:hypothetical protein
MFTDGIKMICYRAETCLLNLKTPFSVRNKDDECRAFKFHTMSTPRANRALKQLCDVMNQKSYVYPGTRMTLVFTTE